MNDFLSADKGSFRDPANRVFILGVSGIKRSARILRGLSAEALENYKSLSEQPFFQKMVKRGLVVKTALLPKTDANVATILRDGWSGVIEHERIPFVTYPYEWTFGMLKDAALLQLSIIESSLENGWTLKDATPYNIQWIGPKPIFIDIASFEPWVNGEPWIGYRQFCSMFLTPLMIRAHIGIDHIPLVRSYLDGIPATEAVKFFSGYKKLQKGVMSHIVFPARVENFIAQRERDDAPAAKRKARKQSKAMVVGLVQSLTRLVKKLSVGIKHSDWSEYDKTHSYQHIDFEAKKEFVQKHVSHVNRDQIWDIGCNTGTFSRIASDFCNQVISIDGDHNAVERLYANEKSRSESNILPIVMDLGNISPNQGWAGAERKAFDQRKKPDLILCLALIHHIRISANIPISFFLEWLYSLRADVILEFVDRRDEMVLKLMMNKKEQYKDYNLDQFISEVRNLFVIEDRRLLKGGKREVFFLKPK